MVSAGKLCPGVGGGGGGPGGPGVGGVGGVGGGFDGHGPVLVPMSITVDPCPAGVGVGVRHVPRRQHRS